MSFCARHGLSIDSTAVMLYLTDLQTSSTGISGRWLRNRLAVLDLAARLDGLQPWTQHPDLKRYINGLHDTHPLGRPERSDPLYRENVEAMMRSHLHPQPNSGQRSGHPAAGPRHRPVDASPGRPSLGPGAPDPCHGHHHPGTVSRGRTTHGSASALDVHPAPHGLHGARPSRLASPHRTADRARPGLTVGRSRSRPPAGRDSRLEWTRVHGNVGPRLRGARRRDQLRTPPHRYPVTRPRAAGPVLHRRPSTFTKPARSRQTTFTGERTACCC